MSLFEKVFKEKGINMTSSRRALFQVLENSKNHLTVDEILNRARKKRQDARPGNGLPYSEHALRTRPD